eukprot:TRINITY_DN541_c0_g1_i1.p1 TRINITY_DN541_c0_g1~~TRINITY_DN541_c0_g1_i1.p1  ORF type:complete len:659 (-),score=331.14 TRINITY_DN541_c0_g1_i1:259-2235(-)
MDAALLSSWKLKAAAAVGALGALVLLGWLTEPAPTADDDAGDERQQQRGRHAAQHQQRGRSAQQQQQAADNDTMMLERILKQADAHRRRGEFGEAETLHRQAIGLLERDPACGPSHIYVGMAYYSLGSMLRQAGQADNALQAIRHALAIFEAALRAGSAGIGLEEAAAQLPEMLANEAELLIELGDLDAADEPLGRSLRLLEARRAAVQRIQLPTPSDDDDDDAQQQLRQRRHQQQQQLVELNQELALLMDQFARLRLKQRRLSEADTMQLKACELLLDELGGLAKPTVSALLRLADIRLERDGVDAATTFEQLLAAERERCAAAAAETAGDVGQPQQQGGSSRRLAQLLVFTGHQRLQQLLQQPLQPEPADYLPVIALYEQASELLLLAPLPPQDSSSSSPQQQQQQQQQENKHEALQLLTDLIVAYGAAGRQAEAEARLETLRQRVRHAFSQQAIQLPYAESRLLRTTSQQVKFEPLVDAASGGNGSGSGPTTSSSMYAPYFAVELLLRTLPQPHPSSAAADTTSTTSSSSVLLPSEPDADSSSAAAQPQPLPLLPPGSLIEATFEGASADGQPLVQELVIEPGMSTVTLKSAPLVSVQRGHYHVKLNVFADASKAQRLAEHHVLIPSLIDSEGITSQNDLYMKLFASAHNLPLPQ